jgi:hypothetical protein
VEFLSRTREEMENGQKRQKFREFRRALKVFAAPD